MAQFGRALELIKTLAMKNVSENAQNKGDNSPNILSQLNFDLLLVFLVM